MLCVDDRGEFAGFVNARSRGAEVVAGGGNESSVAVEERQLRLLSFELPGDD